LFLALPRSWDGTPKQNTIVTVRVPRSVTDEVRTLAERDSESQAVVFRRLLRFQAERERRSDRQHQRGGVMDGLANEHAPETPGAVAR